MGTPMSRQAGPTAARGGVVAWIVVAIVAVAAPNGPASATPITYSAAENAAAFGWLDQYSLDNSAYHFVGNEACVPTSTTNAMTYLQNTWPAIFGSTLTGTTYADWVSTDAVLISPSYMDTTPSQGTFTGPQFYATAKYINDTKGYSQVSFGGQVPSDYWGTGIYSKPAWVQDGFPTWQGLYLALSSGHAAVFTIEYANGGGHGLLAQSFQWTDTNGNGIIEKTENATLSFVDPLDPAYYDTGLPTSGPKITSGHVWNNNDVAGGNLKLEYVQYQGSLPYVSSSYGNVENAKIDTLLTIIVPEPSSMGISATALAAVVAFRCRRGPRGRGRA